MIREDCETLKLKCAETKQVRFWLRRWSRFQQHVRLFWDASRINPSVKPFLKMSEQFFFFVCDQKPLLRCLIVRRFYFPPGGL